MFIEIRQPVISSFSLRLSCGSFVIFPSLPDAPLFTVIGAISAVSVQRSEAQLRLKQPRIKTMTPLAPSISSTFAPSSLSGGVMLKAIMTQLERIDAPLDTLTTELYQVNTRLFSMRHLLLGVTIKTPIARALQKVQGSLTWWWHSFFILCLIITLS